MDLRDLKRLHGGRRGFPHPPPAETIQLVLYELESCDADQNAAFEVTATVLYRFTAKELEKSDYFDFRTRYTIDCTAGSCTAKHHEFARELRRPSRDWLQVARELPFERRPEAPICEYR
jgi:hypothetical protein